VDGPRLGALIATLMAAMALAATNQTMLSTALPSLVGELGRVSEMTWIFTLFTLLSTIGMPIFGRLSDLLSHRTLLASAAAMFAAGSALGAMTTSFELMLVARGAQGLGAGGLIVMPPIVIAAVAPPLLRGKHLGTIGAAFAFMAVAGPLVGGWLTDGPGWRWTFWVNVPLGLMVILGILRWAPVTDRSDRSRVDYAGIVLVAIATTGLVVVATVAGSKLAWTSPPVIGLGAVAVVATILLIAAESRAAQPVMPLALFRDRNFNLTSVAAVLVAITLFAAITYLPTYLQMAAGASATQAGLLMIPMAVMSTLSSILGGRYIARTGRYKLLLSSSALLLAIALASLSTMRPATPLALACLYIGILGVGMGPTMQLLVVVVQNSFPPRLVGPATSAHSYFRQIGATLGASVVGSVFTARLVSLIGDGVAGVRLESLTPEVVRALPAYAQTLVLDAYNAALTPIFLVIAPGGILTAVLLGLIVERPLSARLDRPVPPDPT